MLLHHVLRTWITQAQCLKEHACGARLVQVMGSVATGTVCAIAGVYLALRSVNYAVGVLLLLVLAHVYSC